MVEQLPNAQDLARNPVDVRWSDSTSDRADGGIAASSLFGLIADDLVRQYQVRTVADSQVLRVEFVLVEKRHFTASFSYSRLLLRHTSRASG